MHSLQSAIAPVNPNGAALVALDALDRFLIERGTYDAQARVDVKTEIHQTGTLPTQLIDPEDLADAEAIRAPRRGSRPDRPRSPARNIRQRSPLPRSHGRTSKRKS